MDLQFCDSKTCILCNEMRKKSYLKSKQSVEDRLARIVAKYSNVPLPKKRETDGDWEFQTVVDNQLSGGIV